MTEDELEVYNQGVAQGIKHQQPAPDTIRMHGELKSEVSEMKREWDVFKNRALTILVGSSMALVGYGVWIGTIQSFVTEHSRWVDRMEAKVSEIDKRQQTADVTSAEIKTKLIGIEATLIEIKKAVEKK